MPDDHVFDGEPELPANSSPTATDVRGNITPDDYKQSVKDFYKQALAAYEKHDYATALEASVAGLKTLDLCQADFTGAYEKTLFLFICIATAKHEAMLRILDIKITRDYDGCRDMVNMLGPVLVQDFLTFIRQNTYRFPPEIKYPWEIIKLAGEYKAQFDALLKSMNAHRLWLESPEKIYDTGY